jgi:hypothetical protein
MKAKGAGDTEHRTRFDRSAICRPRFACFNSASGVAIRSTSAGLFVFLDAVEGFFKLGDERGFARGETVATHDAP